MPLSVQRSRCGSQTSLSAQKPRSAPLVTGQFPQATKWCGLAGQDAINLGVVGDLIEAPPKLTEFKERIVLGMLSAGFISAVLGTSLPRANSIRLGQELIFKAPVKIGDTITATVEVVELIEAKNRVIFTTTVTNRDGVVVTDGKATVLER